MAWKKDLLQYRWHIFDDEFHHALDSDSLRAGKFADDFTFYIMLRRDLHHRLDSIKQVKEVLSRDEWQAIIDGYNRHHWRCMQKKGLSQAFMELVGEPPQLSSLSRP